MKSHRPRPRAGVVKRPPAKPRFAQTGNTALRALYQAEVSNRLNNVMRLLTIISTIFIPLSFIAGLYGMNFDQSSPWNMPELHWKYGYPFAWVIMLLTAGALGVYFRRQQWI